MTWEILKLAAEFGLKLFSGELWGIWRAHKQTEAENARNKANAQSDAAAVGELRSNWTRKP